MHVLILHNAVREDAAEDERDVLVQVEAAARALRNAHEVQTLGCTLDLQQLDDELRRIQPDVVFNLVEALGGTDRLALLAPALLEARGIAFTGNNALALQLTNDKLTTKQWMRGQQLPAATSFTMDQLSCGATVPPGQYIVKAIHEHASLGLDDDAVLYVEDSAALLQHIEGFQSRWRRPCFAEPYIDGREFNLSLLTDSGGGVQVLPPAEILFPNFPDNKPRIVGYKAKWDVASWEYEGTPRRFAFPPTDDALLKQLELLARQCWTALNLSGYVRVDFRVDNAGRPWILEVNTNPCLSPDAGFAAALEKAQIPYAAAIERIVHDALTRRWSLRAADKAGCEGTVRYG